MGACGRMSENNTPDIPFRRLLRTIPADYWRLWYVGMIVSTVRWLETVVDGRSPSISRPARPSSSP